MARIRSIKPEFWTDGTIIRLPFEVRLFYIGMWNFACDRGHVEDDPFGLKLKILPADQVDGDSLVEQLVDSGRVERLDVEGRSFLSIPRFNDHQRVDTRWKSRCPACSHLDSQELTETHTSLPDIGADQGKHETRVSSRETHGIVTRPHVGGEGEGKDRKGGEGEDVDTPPAPKCRKHDGWDHHENCRLCGEDRKAHEAWENAQARKPRPVKPHQHQWFPDGTCLTCEERREVA